MPTKFARAAGGNWNTDATWSTTSGGGADTVKPTAADDVRLDAASGAVSIDAAGACRSLDCLGYTNTLSYAGSFNIAIGDATAGTGNIALRLVAAMTFAPSAAQTLSFISTSTTQQTVTTAGKACGAMTFNGLGGSWILTDNLTLTGASLGTLNVTQGTFDTASKALAIAQLSSSGTSARTLVLGQSAITATATGANSLSSTNATGLTVAANTAVITLSGATGSVISAGTDWGGLTVVFATSASARTFAGGGCTNISMTYVVAGSVGSMTVTGANRFNTIRFSDITNARTLALPTANGITVTNFIVNGTSGKLMTVTGDVTKINGVVSCDFLSISSSDATGGAKFFAGANSTDGGSNTGWVFTVPKSAAVPIGSMDAQRSLNRIAGTTGLDAQGAANVWAGTVGLDLVGALNWRAGSTGLDYNGVCKELARLYVGNAELDAQGALASIP
jgi:hypothetical protein